MRQVRNNSSIRSIQKTNITGIGDTTITAVNPAKTMLYCITRAGANVTGPTNIGQGSLAAHLTDSTTITTVSRGSMSNSNYGTLYVNVVEYE